MLFSDFISQYFRVWRQIVVLFSGTNTTIKSFFIKENEQIIDSRYCERGSCGYVIQSVVWTHLIDVDSDCQTPWYTSSPRWSVSIQVRKLLLPNPYQQVRPHQHACHCPDEVSDQDTRHASSGLHFVFLLNNSIGLVFPLWWRQVGIDWGLWKEQGIVSKRLFYLRGWWWSESSQTFRVHTRGTLWV